VGGKGLALLIGPPIPEADFTSKNQGTPGAKNKHKTAGKATPPLFIKKVDKKSLMFNAFIKSY
jgi:hypothetical protein